ncbi:hypothetical protein E4U45_003958 [Claviceps purpurea]|nr:hypothetical protein E4U45_003958 [Claviceps purpurea]
MTWSRRERKLGFSEGIVGANSIRWLGADLCESHGSLGFGKLVQGLVDIGDADRTELDRLSTAVCALREGIDDMIGLSPALAKDEVVVKVSDHVAEDTLTAAVDVQVQTITTCRLASMTYVERALALGGPDFGLVGPRVEPADGRINLLATAQGMPRGGRGRRLRRST